MKRKIYHTLLVASIIAALIVNVIGVIFAQSDCGDYECIDESNFSDDDLNGWTASNGGNFTDTALAWMASKTFGLLWWSSTADGVLTATGTKPIFNKTISLMPGNYRMIVRVASDKQCGLLGNTLRAYATPPGGVTFGVDSWSVTDRFDAITSDAFVVSAPGDVTIELSGENSVMLYFDYIWIVEDNTVATATPAAGTPSATPIPASATPIATATPFCIAAPSTPTPGPPQFELTPTPSPTPNPLTNWTVFDPFDYATLRDIWEVAGNGVYNSLSTGRGTSKPGAAYIPYSVDPPGWTYAEMEREALIWQPSPVISDTAYVDGWARTDFVPQGTSVYIEIWYLDTDTLLWSQAATTQVSASNWYNFHHAITPTLEIAAIAFLSSRDDDATGSGVYLDDVYMYNDLDNAPYCDGSYPSGTDRHGSGDPVNDPTTTTTITIPANRPCPIDVKVPNNFWGPLLAGMTLFLDQIFSAAPYHTPDLITDMARDFLLSPVSIFFILAATLFDLRIYLVVMLIFYVSVAVQIPFAVWQIVKENVPFL